MSSNLRPAVIAARRLLADGRAKLKQQHEEGTPGIQLCAKLTDLADQVVTDLFRVALDDLAAVDKRAYQTLGENVALIAHSGYGRRELAPFSDIDLMFLHRAAISKQVAMLAERLLRDIFDLGVILGHSVRTPQQAISLACQDAQIFTSLTESRFVAGNQQLAESFLAKFKATAVRRAKRLLPAIEEERRSERRQYGETNFLLEPNIKRSRGGLRDIQLIRWVGFCCYGATDLDSLSLSGVLEREEQLKLRDAAEFLLRTRNDVHFHTGKAHDQLDRLEQVRLAEKLGYQGHEALLPVELFMQDYFRHTGAVRYISSRFLANANRKSRMAGVVDNLLSHRVEGDFLVGPYRITATKRGLQRIQSGDLSEILRLAELSTLYDKRIAHDTWEAVRKAAAASSGEITPEVAARFMALLSQPPQLARLLGQLHDLGVLEKLIPAVARTRGLLQFNEYHKYTVDEHSIKAVECATNFAKRDDPLGRVYSSIKQKELLHLALLLHDLGKGYTEDHSEVGRRIATETAARLFLPKHECEVLEFLVHQHLTMTHLALWRDISDPAVSLGLAVEVGSPEVLRKLYVLSAADLNAVGPDVLNDWKIELLTRLYKRTLTHLSDDPAQADVDRWLDKRRAAVIELLSNSPDAAWYQEHVAGLPAQYLEAAQPDQIAATLKKLHDLPPHKAIAWGDFQAGQSVVEFTIGAHEAIAPGIFHRLSGALSSAGVEILSAQINTLNDGLVLDRFYVTDPDFAGPPPAERIESIAQRLVDALEKPASGPPAFRRTWNQNITKAADLAPMPARVIYDNATSERATILQIFASDRRGLLYEIARTIYDLGLSVVNAKIGTHLDQVVDVFYVTDEQGNKIDDEQRLEEVRRRLFEAVDAFENATAAAESK
jgi:[protein-PII] uridylyltransferase